MNNENKLINDFEVVNFILDIDWMTTKEFCDKYGYTVLLPVGTTSEIASQILVIDGFKWHKINEFAKKARRSQKEHKPTTIGELEKRGEI